ncbi:hypothetical protein HanXRQr2_Chr04g0157761 [Helianthus annuus]|uniref:Uncharacterized protein n=1 Tax=Helianthus annuus TaxID=4232 RepID=A0A9K3J6A8_HELAN|nr:hypothetical protein HanXRQr2_Chr04g0157761 [Helianthus annuus]
MGEQITRNLSDTSTKVEVRHIRLSRKRQLARGPGNDTSHAKKKTHVSTFPPIALTTNTLCLTFHGNVT